MKNYNTYEYEILIYSMYRGEDPDGSKVSYFISGDYLSVDSNTGEVSTSTIPL